MDHQPITSNTSAPVPPHGPHQGAPPPWCPATNGGPRWCPVAVVVLDAFHAPREPFRQRALAPQEGLVEARGALLASEVPVVKLR